MLTYPNQEAVTVHKPPLNENDHFLQVNQEAVRIAAQRLKHGSLKLWLYLAENSDGYVLALSQRELMKWGLSKNTYSAAKRELKDNGYLRLRKGNHFDFYVFPEVKATPPMIDESETAIDDFDLDSIASNLSGGFKQSPKSKQSYQAVNPYKSGDY